jgi:hypothetical protein
MAATSFHTLIRYQYQRSGIAICGARMKCASLASGWMNRR